MKFISATFLVALSATNKVIVDAAKERLQACIHSYPGTDHDVTGKVLLAFREGKDELSVVYKIEKVEANVEAQMTVHWGTTCKDASQIDGPFYDPSIVGDNPWTVANGATYFSDWKGRAFDRFKIETGFTHDVYNGRALVVYDADGNPTGCGILSTYVGPCEYKACVEPYPGTSSTSSVDGKVSVTVRPEDDETVYEYVFKNLEPRSTGATYIGTGSSCNDPSQVGGPFFNATFGPNPWTQTYRANRKGSAIGAMSVYTGYPQDINLGLTVVVEDTDGNGVGCGVLTFGSFNECDLGNTNAEKAQKLQTCLTPYSGASVKGNKVVIEFFSFSGELTLNYYYLKDLEPDVTVAGIFISTATSCSDPSLAGGRYYNTAVDPWTAANGAVYTTNRLGSAATGQFTIATGFGYDDNNGHAVILLDSSGTAVACGILSAEKQKCNV